MIGDLTKITLQGILREVKGGPMEDYASHLVIALNLFKSTERQGIPTEIEVNGPYDLFATLQSCGGHINDFKGHIDIYYRVYKKQFIPPVASASLPTIIYQSPNNSLLETAIMEMQLDLCIFPFTTNEFIDKVYLNEEYLKKYREFEKEGKMGLRMDLAASGLNISANTYTTPRYNFPVYNLQKKDVANKKKSDFIASDVVNVRLDFLKLAKHLLKIYHPGIYQTLHEEIEKLELECKSKL